MLKRVNSVEQSKFKLKIVEAASRLVQRKGSLIIILAALVVLFSLTGASRLIVENSFIKLF